MSDLKLLALAPPGQVESMAADLTALTSKEYTKEVVKYFEDNFAILKVNDLPVMVSKFNKTTTETETTYKDINGVFKLDKYTAVKVSDVPESDLSKLVNELQQWLSDFYPNGVIRVFENENGHEICINSTAIKHTAYWSSHWISHYHVPKTGNVTAAIKVLIHYYEDGNVQMNANKTFTVDPLKEFNAKTVLELIKTVEHKYHEQVKTVDMTETFKNLRRQLPLTKQEIEWEKLAGYQLMIRSVENMDGVAVEEMEMLTEMFNRINVTCREKCITQATPDLSKGESVCIDRCVAKYFKVNLVISKYFQDLQAGKQ